MTFMRWLPTFLAFPLGGLLATQSTLLARGRLVAAAWTALSAASWSLGWLATWATIVDIERGYYVFGAGGALLVTIVTGLTLRRVLAAPGAIVSAARPAATLGA